MEKQKGIFGALRSLPITPILLQNKILVKHPKLGKPWDFREVSITRCKFNHQTLDDIHTAGND